ncbi:MAG TPA: MmcQ/YjbR family DNA-binding protein [Bryobacteraceae bacterium]
MTTEDFRRIALSMPGALEKAHMGHPDFRVKGKIFATLWPKDGWGMVKLNPEQQHEFVRAEPNVFAAVKGAWGLRGCTSVHLDAASEKTVRSAISAAWKLIASKR